MTVGGTSGKRTDLRPEESEAGATGAGADAATCDRTGRGGSAGPGEKGCADVLAVAEGAKADEKSSKADEAG